MVSNLVNVRSNVRRLNQITRILTKYGLAQYIGDSTPGFLRRRFVEEDGTDLSELPFNVRLRLALTELGTTFIKMGQMISQRPDMVGPELAEELASLQADTPADPPEVVRETVETELGEPVEDIFPWFNFEALASASVGQVHVATLQDGSDVVVKVQHAGIEEKVHDDLSLLMTLAKTAEQNSKEVAIYKPTATVAEFRRSLLRELDFTIELNNLLQFTQNFKDDPEVHFPIAYPDQSSHRVMTMERLAGYSIADTARMDENNVDREAFAERFVGVMLDMIFRDGFYHADPHPGNVFVVTGERVGMLDCGKVGRVDEQTQDDFINIVTAFITGDAEMLTDELIDMCEVPPDLDRNAYQADVAEFIAEFGNAPGGIDLGAAFESMFGIIRTHHLLVPARVNMLLLVIVQTEGTARLLDPNFDMAKALRGYGSDLARRRFSPKRVQKELTRAYRDWTRLIRAVPREAVALLEQAQRGEIQIHVQQHGMERPMNRLNIGIMTSALLLGSAMLWAAGAPPTLFGISVFGALGVALALFMGFLVLVQIWRSSL